MATPALVDPNFHRAVVLILQHDDEEGAVGVVLNRPSTVTLADALPAWGHLAAPPSVVFVGGPVEPSGVVGLARAHAHPDGEAWRPIVGPVGLLDLSLPPGEVEVDQVRLFTGYAGWSPGQLEQEIAGGSWFVVDAQPDDAFTNDAQHLWRAVLTRQGGVFRTIPADPSLN